MRRSLRQSLDGVGLAPPSGWRRAAIVALLVLGVALRLRSYLANRSLWYDESFLALNIIDRDFAGLARPLDHNQAAPLGFLWAERLFVNLFGSSEYALRAVPLLAAICALVVFWWLVSMSLPAAGTVLAIAMFSISEPLIRYAVEVKQYSLDVAIAAILWATFTKMKSRLDHDDLGAWALATLLGAATIWVSHPAIFVLGGISIHWLWLRLRRHTWNELLMPASCSFIWVGSFIALYVVSLRFVPAPLQAAWSHGHANAPLVPLAAQDLDRFVDVVWTLSVIPLGHHVVQLVTLGAVVGVVALWRHGHAQLWWFAGTLALVWLASSLGKYPVALRLWLFFAPAIILLVAAGVDEVWRHTRRTFPVLAPIVACLILAYPIFTAANAALWPRGHEEIRPLLQKLREHYRDGDCVYLYSRASRAAALYYAKRGMVIPGTVVVGMESADRYQGEADVQTLQGRGRVWVLFSHVRQRPDGLDDEKLFVHLLDRVGVRLGVTRQTGASLYLYDLSRRP
jgi:uncharacterized membrane protein